MSISKELYKKLCEQDKSIPLFLSFGWINNIVKPNEWDIVIEQRNGEIVGFILFYKNQRLFLKQIAMPSLTPYMGIWLKYPPEQKYVTKLSYEKKIYNALIEKLPVVGSFSQKFYPTFTNWLPFFWKGFQQTTMYTYVIEDTKNINVVFSNFKENIKREIRKALKSLTISEAHSIEALYNIKLASYKEHKKKLPISFDYLNKVYNYCIASGCGKILELKDSNNSIHCSALIVWDNEYCYYLFGGSYPEYKNSGAMSLLMWEAINFSSSQNLSFNFEGSMIEPVERFFRGFGAKQIPYFKIYKTNSFLLKLKDLLLT